MPLDIKKVKLSSRDIKHIYFDAFPKKRENAVFHDGFDVQVMEYTILKFL